jgi:hypothetical protein
MKACITVFCRFPITAQEQLPKFEIRLRGGRHTCSPHGSFPRTLFSSHPPVSFKEKRRQMDMTHPSSNESSDEDSPNAVSKKVPVGLTIWLSTKSLG